MKEKFNLKKLLKLAGKILSIVAILFIVKKFMDIDFDYSMLLEPKSFGFFILLIVLQTLIILVGAGSWKVIVEILSGKKLKLFDVEDIYVKANLMKYIPGNIFHYVARNELAIKNNISHVDVAMATVLDTGICLVVGLVFAICLVGKTAIEYIQANFDTNVLMILGIVAVIGFILVVVVAYIFRNKIKGLVGKATLVLQWKNIPRTLEVILIYVVNNVITCAMYIACIVGIFDVKMGVGQLVSLAGAYVFAMIIGMVTPGASAGIGIREAVMVWIAGSQDQLGMITVSMVIIRISSVLADIFAYLLRGICILALRRKTEDE